MSATSSGRFSIIPTAAVEDRRISAPALRTLALLGTYANRQGWCWPSHSVLAKRLQIGRTTVLGHIQELSACGYLQVEHRRREGDRGATSNKYRLLFDLPNVDGERVSEQPTPPVGQIDRPCRELFDTPLSAASRHQERTQKERTSPSVMGRADQAAQPDLKPSKTPKPKFTATPLTVTDLPDEWRAYALEKGHPDADAEFENFRDYWAQRAHEAKGRKSDWFAAWRFWVRRSFEFASKREANSAGGGRRGALNTLFAGAARAAGR